MPENGLLTVRIRKAVVEDFENIYPLLVELLNSDLQKSQWFNLFQNHWCQDDFSPGIVLEAGNKIVGFLGTIYSQQKLNNKVYQFCNLTSWVVKDKYRMYSVSMLFSLLKEKHLILTSFTSNAKTYEIYKKLGFKDLDNTRRLIYSNPFSDSSHEYQFVLESYEIEKNLDESEQLVYKQHKIFDGVFVLVRYKSEKCLIMGIMRQQDLVIYSVRNRYFFKKHLSKFRNGLFSCFDIKRIQIDELLLENEPIFFSRKVSWGFPYQVRAEEFSNVNCISAEYSELFLLGI